MVLKHTAIAALALVLCSCIASSDGAKCGKFEMLIPHEPECERTCFNQCPLRSKRRVLVSRPTCVCLPGYVRRYGECVPLSYCEYPDPPCPPTPCPTTTTPCPTTTTPCPTTTTPSPTTTTPCPTTTTPCPTTTTPCPTTTTLCPPTTSCRCTTPCKPCNSCGSPCQKKSRCSCYSCPKARPVYVDYYY